MLSILSLSLFTFSEYFLYLIPFFYLSYKFPQSFRNITFTSFIVSSWIRRNLFFADWLIGRRSNLSTQSKITLYKTIIKPVWTYGIQLWGTASNSNIEIHQRFQSKTLRSLIGAPWHVTNETIHRNLKIPTVREEITKCSNRYIIRVSNHRNPLVTQLLNTSDQIRRLRKRHSLDLSTRFS